MQAREIQRKYEKNNSETKGKLAKTTHIESRLQENQAHAKRLQGKVDSVNKLNTQLTKLNATLETENADLKMKISDMWRQKEEEHEALKVMMKYEQTKKN